MVDLTLCRPVKLGKNVVLFFPPTPLDFLDLLRRVIPVVGATIAARGYRKGKNMNHIMTLLVIISKRYQFL